MIVKARYVAFILFSSFLWMGPNLAAQSAALVPTDEAAVDISAIHDANDGATYSLYFRNMAGKKLYAISLYPDRTVVVDGKTLLVDTILKFINANINLLNDPRLSVGTWYDAQSNKCYLDVTATLEDRDKSIALAKKYNQISIFDLFRMQEIKTGGDGKSVQSLPPASERLSALTK